MARVRDEAPLALEGVSEPREQVVERVAEAGELVARGGDGQLLVEVRLGQRICSCAHPLDGAKRRGGERVPDQRDEEKRNGGPDEELAP